MKTKIKKLIQVMRIYLFKSKKYPNILYNIYGSEGHSSDREYVDNMIEKYGFWNTYFKLKNQNK